MALDSKAHFESVVRQRGLLDHLSGFQSIGADTLANLAFATSYQPGNTDDEAFTRQIVIPVLGDEHHILKPAVKRIWFEAFHSVAVDAQRRANLNEETRPRKIPPAERNARLKAIKALVEPGIRVADELEPSHAIQDKFSMMMETGLIKRVAWKEYTTRDSELDGVEVLEYFKTDSSGFMRAFTCPEELPADISSEMLTKNALQRRGIAMHMAGLMSWPIHEQLLNTYFQAYYDKPLPGYARTTFEQINQADLYVFKKLADNLKEDLTLPPDGSMPFDNHIQAILISHKFGAILAQRQTSRGSEPAGPKRQAEAEADRLREENKRLKSAASQRDRSGDFDRGKGKRKGKGKGNKDKGKGKITPPAALQGIKPFGGKRYCFKYNLGSCPQKDDQCKNGLHRCMKCGGAHAVGDPKCPMR